MRGVADAPRVDPSREAITAWLTVNCGTGLPHGEVTDLAGALHALAYMLRQIESTNSYMVHIGQCTSATTGIRWVLDYFAATLLSAQTLPEPDQGR